MKDENVRIEVGSKLLWKSYSHMGYKITEGCVVTVTRIYKDCSFRVEDADSKDKGRFKDARSQFSRRYDNDERPEVEDWGNVGWGNTTGKIYSLPENVTDKTLAAEIKSQKAKKAKEEAKAQAERDAHQAMIVEAQGDRLTSRLSLMVDPDLMTFRVLTKNGNELTVIYSFEIRSGFDFKTEEILNEYHVTAQAYGSIWVSSEKSWTSLTRDGRTIDEALEAVAVSLWD